MEIKGVTLARQLLCTLRRLSCVIVELYGTIRKQIVQTWKRKSSLMNINWDEFGINVHWSLV